MKIKALFVLTFALVLVVGAPAWAQIRPTSGKVLVPASSIEKPTDIGDFAHTNIQVFLPAEPLLNHQSAGPPYPGYAYETPASLACVYGLVSQVTGCNPNKATAVPSGGSRMIALVDAYDAPNAASDLPHSPHSSVYRLRVFRSCSPAEPGRNTTLDGNWKNHSTCSGPMPWLPTLRSSWWKQLPTALPT